MIQMLKAILGDPKAKIQENSWDAGALVLRLGFGGMMAIGHGWGKFTKFLNEVGSEEGVQFADPLGIGTTLSLAGAASAEFLAAVALMLGLATRLAAIPLVFTMLVAAFLHHGDDPFFMGGGPSKEPAVIYAVAYLAMLIFGPGRFSLDYLIAKKLG